mgnify:CR=1 FL=1
MTARWIGGAAAAFAMLGGGAEVSSAQTMDDMIFHGVFVDRLEVRSNDGDPVLLWDADAWVGGDVNKLWLRTEGDPPFDGRNEDAARRALWSRAITPYFDVQIGVRHDIRPKPARTHAVIGLQGLAPFWYEVDAALFVSDTGDVTGRIEAENDFLITQRLMLAPRAELSFAAQDVPELGIGAGLNSVEIDLRVKYSVTRDFAPYVGVSWSRAVGDTADFRRADGEGVGSVSFVAGFSLSF